MLDIRVDHHCRQGARADRRRHGQRVRRHSAGQWPGGFAPKFLPAPESPNLGRVPREVQRCYELGCNVYVTKPIGYDEFIEAVKRLGMFLAIVKVPREDERL